MTAVAVVCVRSGALPAGTLDAVAAADGRVVLVGGDTAAAAEARAVITSYLSHLLGRPTRVAARLRPAQRRRTS